VTSSAASLDPGPWWRFRRWPGRLFDVGVVLALLAVGAAIVLSTTNAIPRLNRDHAVVFAVVLAALAGLLVRRSHPLLMLGLVIVALVAEGLLRASAIVTPIVLVAVYTLAARLTWRLALPLTTLTFAAFLAAGSVSRGELSFSNFVASFIPIAGAYAVGAYVGTRVAYIDALRARAEQLTREQDLLARQAVADERVRIARELHDVVAHNLSLITVQAGALQTQVGANSPARATADVIARTGRQAMDEMRRMLGVLRLGDAADIAGRAPQPGIADIDALVEETRRAGVDVVLRMDDVPAALPPGVDLSAYRIVQEALTNVLRHAGPAHCTVDVRRADGALQLRITDDGRGAPAGAPGSRGHGLVGMRERVALFGGELFAGPVPGGGFAVQATLPLHVQARA